MTDKKKISDYERLLLKLDALVDVFARTVNKTGFIEVDVVEFQDSGVPYTTIILNPHYIKQIQPIDNNHQSIYLKNQATRREAKEDALRDRASGQKNVDIPFVSTVDELPNGGAVIYYLVPHGAQYYTVTPFKEVRAKLLGIFDYGAE